MNQNIKRIEDIYPLTIVNRRFGGMALVNAESDCQCVGDLQWNEEWIYGDTTQKTMADEYGHVAYGVGESLDDAFKDFLKRKKEMDENPPNYSDDPLTPEQEAFLTKAASMFIPHGIGSAPMDLQKMSGPTGRIFYFDSVFSGF